MNVEIGAEAALFPEKEYINGIAVAVRQHQTSYTISSEFGIYYFKVVKLSTWTGDIFKFIKATHKIIRYQVYTGRDDQNLGNAQITSFIS
jgi:hypothetical protein